MRKAPALKDLERMAYEKKKEKHPGMPEHAIPKTTYTDQTTNGLTLAVIDCFKLHGFFATRIDSKGTWSQRLKRFIPSNQKKGLPDVFCQVPGLPPIWVEVKCDATKDRLKSHQIDVIHQLRRTGAIVYLAHNFEDFYEWFKHQIQKRETINII